MPVGGAAYVNDTANNAIRNALLGAVEHLSTGLAEGSDGIVDIRITVGEGTYEGGVDLGASDDANSLRTKLLESLGLRGDGEGPIANISIVAEDAMETDADGNENPTANANGRAVIEGDLIFDGFNTLLAGIYIGMNGKINAANGDRFSYYGTELDDDVDIEVDSVGEVTVDTGDGDDTVTLTVKQEPTTRVDADPQAIRRSSPPGPLIMSPPARASKSSLRRTALNSSWATWCKRSPRKAFPAPTSASAPGSR